MRKRSALFWMTATYLTGAAQLSVVQPALASERGEGAATRLGTPGLPHPFPLELAFSRRGTFADYEKAAISPAGKHLAYGVRTPCKRRNDVSTLASGLPTYMAGTRLNLTDLSSGKTIALGADGSTSFSPAWSPDGTKLAYYSDEGGVLRPWIFDVLRSKGAAAAEVRVKAHLYSTVAMPPTWSPDGRYLLVPALPADETGADPRPPFGMPTDGKQSHPLGTDVLVLASGAEPAPPASIAPRTFSRYGAVADITAIDIRDGTSRVVLPAKPAGRSGPAFARYSPSGRFLAYVSHFRPGPTPQAEDVIDLGVIKAAGTEPLFVEEITGVYDGYESYSGDLLGRSGIILAWHPTEDVLLFLNAHRLRGLHCTRGAKPRAATLAADWGRLSGDYLAFDPDRAAALVGLLPPTEGADSHRVGALGLVPLDGSPGRRIPLPKGFHGGQVIRRDGVSLWQRGADTATFLAGDKDGSQTLVHRLDLNSGEWTRARSEPATVEFHCMTPDGSFVVGTLQGYSRPPDFYRLAADFAPQARLSAIEPRLDARPLGQVETFQTVVPLHDGRLESVRTAVLLPPEAKRGDRLPALVECYGGYNASRGIREYGGGLVSSIPAPVFTTRGIAVLLADAPLGPEGQPGQPVEELRDVILPQVYRAADLGYIDIERVAVTGQSYGGYCAAGLVSTTNLFRAGVAVSGIYDLASHYGTLRLGDNFPVEVAEKGQLRMGQPPWTDLRRYLDNSPYYRADHIHTPLLIIHGRNDSGPSVTGAEKMFSALRRLGRTAQLVVYEDQGHAIWEWEPKQAVDAAERMLDFLRRHLGMGRDPSSGR
jgi:dipeptidyl aminopeptidase/acylaminoacyl peptidase